MRHRSTPGDRTTVRGGEQAGQTGETADLMPFAQAIDAPLRAAPPDGSEKHLEILWRTG
jgi:hypothetical protein